ncbi:MAG: hypothetical protein NT084_14600 [Bacteroidetes bacterium]|nr:hypothetical protein [Bacteroidota bacterium]
MKASISQESMMLGIRIREGGSVKSKKVFADENTFLFIAVAERVSNFLIEDLARIDELLEEITF